MTPPRDALFRQRRGMMIKREPNERVLGYDLRVWSESAPDWLEQRRQQYLLRPTVQQPLSTDEMVWSSVLGDAVTAETTSPIRRPQWTGPIQSLWDDLNGLIAHVDHACGRHWPPSRLIAVTLLYGLVPAEERQRWDERIVDITPQVVASDWKLLGYDVSDEWLLSGLSNCGYEADESPRLQRQWAPHLNEHHLFDDAGRASEFAAVTDERVEEHAPFYVYGVYSIPMSGRTPGSEADPGRAERNEAGGEAGSRGGPVLEPAE